MMGDSGKLPYSLQHTNSNGTFKHSSASIHASLSAASSAVCDTADGGDNDAQLFDTPADLLCPITHELFKEPVINAVGQVYEKAAIERHLTRKGRRWGSGEVSGATRGSTQGGGCGVAWWCRAVLCCLAGS